MPIASRLLRRLGAVALTTAVAVSVTSSASAGTPAVVSTAVSTTTSVVVPTTCGVIFHRALAGSLNYGEINGTRARAGTLGAMTFGGSSEVPVAMTYVRTLSSPRADQYMVTLADGSLWEARAALDGSKITTRVLKTSGWSSIRELVTGASGLVYGLTYSGGLKRYTYAPNGVVKGAGIVATSGWGGIRTLTFSGGGTYKGVEVDGLMAINSVGALREYLIHVGDAKASGFTLRASGWSGIRRISVGSCDNSGSRPIAGITTNGVLRLYLDTHGYDLSGADIRTYGEVGHGFSGLLFD